MQILLVDDDALVTGGLKTIIEMASKHFPVPYEICGIGRNGEEALALYETLQPDLVLMDIRMPVMDGIASGQELLSRWPEAKLIYLTTFLEDDYIIEALKLGAKGYLMKTDYESILPAIEAVHSGQRVFGDEIVAKIPSFLDRDHAKSDHVVDLNEKELELISHVAEGLNNKEIAQVMHFSEGTIRNYLSTILEKLDLRDRTQLAIYYYKNLQ